VQKVIKVSRIEIAFGLPPIGAFAHSNQKKSGNKRSGHHFGGILYGWNCTPYDPRERTLLFTCKKRTFDKIVKRFFSKTSTLKFFLDFADC
jgi:hypothetical protein